MNLKVYIQNLISILVLYGKLSRQLLCTKYRDLKKPYDQLIDNHECDICVVGGGFSGLSTAIEAAKKGLKVIVIEQNLFGWGASGRNGGQIWNDVSWGIDVIEKKYGIKLARQIWDISQASVDLIDDRIRNLALNVIKKMGELVPLLARPN